MAGCMIFDPQLKPNLWEHIGHPMDCFAFKIVAAIITNNSIFLPLLLYNFVSFPLFFIPDFQGLGPKLRWTAGQLWAAVLVVGTKALRQTHILLAWTTLANLDNPCLWSKGGKSNNIFPKRGLEDHPNRDWVVLLPICLFSLQLKLLSRRAQLREE